MNALAFRAACWRKYGENNIWWRMLWLSMTAAQRDAFTEDTLPSAEECQRRFRRPVCLPGSAAVTVTLENQHDAGLVVVLYFKSTPPEPVLRAIDAHLSKTARRRMTTQSVCYRPNGRHAVNSGENMVTLAKIAMHRVGYCWFDDVFNPWPGEYAEDFIDRVNRLFGVDAEKFGHTATTLHQKGTQ